jgi:uncharacterized membrane protein HdeD (DUF308 family)
MSPLAEVKQEWRLFRDDTPGERFSNHRKRMERKPRGHSLIAVGLGVVLIIAGVVMLFTPGPGSVAILFGFALIASHSKKLSGVMDRAEPKLRELAHQLERKWKALPRPRKLGLLLGVAALAAAGLLFMWRFVVSAYLLA